MVRPGERILFPLVHGQESGTAFGVSQSGSGPGEQETEGEMDLCVSVGSSSAAVSPPSLSRWNIKKASHPGVSLPCS